MNEVKFQRPIMDLIKSRISWRSYENRPLEPHLRDFILEYLANQTIGPLGHPMRFSLIEKSDPVIFDNARLGTYGFIKNAQNFIAGAIVPGEKHWEDYGYILEKIILKMTDLSLGTCWMGGTFKRGEFGKAIDVRENEIVPAVTPVGYPTEVRSFRDQVIRWGAKSHRRKPWEDLFFEDGFRNPLKRDSSGEYAPALDMVRLAPSASNKQPWRIVQQDQVSHFFLKRIKISHGKSLDLQRIDMGIAMCHFELTARELGLNGRWEAISPEIERTESYEYCITWKKTSLL